MKQKCYQCPFRKKAEKTEKFVRDRVLEIGGDRACHIHPDKKCFGYKQFMEATGSSVPHGLENRSLLDKHDRATRFASATYGKLISQGADARC